MEKEKITFAPCVMVIDAVALDGVVGNMRRYFSAILHRELPLANLAMLLEYLVLDAGCKPDAARQVQVILVYESGKERLTACEPSDFRTELHGQAFQGTMGEFSIGAYQPSGMTTREALFTETLQLLAESKEAEQWILVPDLDEYGREWRKALKEKKEKVNCMLFGMENPGTPEGVAYEQLGYAVLRALGVRADEF